MRPVRWDANDMTPRLIAVIDDDPVFVDLMRAFLESEGYAVVHWTRGRGARAFLQRSRPELVLLDVRMEDAEAGRRVLARLGPDRPAVIVCTADTRFLTEQAAWLSQRCEAVIAKPFDLDELQALIERVLDAPTRHTTQ
jgi:CheY-like chemotaxis protein